MNSPYDGSKKRDPKKKCKPPVIKKLVDIEITEVTIPSPVAMPGWVCPVCGRGNSPYTSTCPCIPQILQITC